MRLMPGGMMAELRGLAVHYGLRTLVALSFAILCLTPARAQETCNENNTVFARVVALDQAWVWNRYGALQPHGMMFALEHDIRVLDPSLPAGQRELSPGESFSAGKVTLRTGKRPRPLVLRVNKGGCLEIRFTNLLDPNRRNQFKPGASPSPPPHHRCPGPADDPEQGCGDQPGDRWAGFYVTGLTPAAKITDMAQHVGANPTSLVAPGSSTIYRQRADEEGTFFAYSPAAASGGDGNGGSIHAGLFAAVHVEPTGSVWYRSQVSAADMPDPGTGSVPSYDTATMDKFALLKGREIVHSDLNAVIDMRGAVRPKALLCLDENGKPYEVCGDRTKSFREFTAIFHDESGAVQAFDEFDTDDSQTDADKAMAKSLQSVRDGFAINYGTAGAGAEVLATRKKVGPVKNCVECQLEEYFLSSWAVGDPAMVVDKPANMQVPGMPFAGQAATRAYFPDDPSNVYHSYLNDRVVIRNIHAGPKEHHVFHLHAHQWLQVDSKPESAYLDSQTIGPGGAYSYEIAYGGSGNRNRTPGDSIFHCHFYPHFAQGMWALWRVHDVFERGTILDGEGTAAPSARALPDGEIARGTPIPALIPLPDMPLPPNPGPVIINAGQVDLAAMDAVNDPNAVGYRYPGYPFQSPARAGHRPPTPPRDVLEDGGLERHVVLAGTVADRAFPSFVRDYGTLNVRTLPEAGTIHEQRASDFHAANHASALPTGGAATFLTNGLKAAPGAPFADPCRGAVSTRRYQAAVFEYDMIFTKKGWHTPQARILALRDDVLPTKNGDRLPQPFFFRANSGQCIEFQHSNVVPKEYKLDSFQLNVPTDIIGQHIHLVKFDVQASDGGANGFNYEDGTPSAQEVVARIMAIRRASFGGPTADVCDPLVDPDDNDELKKIAQGLVSGVRKDDKCPVAESHPWFPNITEWNGGQVTVQRWFADTQNAPDWRGVDAKLVDARDVQKSFDKTLDTVFTHDHFGASTHQQTGLYAGLIVEPSGSRWFDARDDGSIYELGRGREDGGPTSWKAVVLGKDGRDTFREFALEYQDFLVGYRKEGKGVGCRFGDPAPINAPWQVADADAGDYTGTSLPRLLKHEYPPNGTRQCWPEAVSADDIGTMAINYRAEPIPPRIWDPASQDRQAPGAQGDLSYIFKSITRADSDLNRSQASFPLVGGVGRPNWPVPTPGMTARDPFTPLLEVYERDPFRIRLLAGAHEHEHSFTINSFTWQTQRSDPNSGYRSFQGTALSEHFEFEGALDIPASATPMTFGRRYKQLDHLYKVGASIEDVWYGNWGLIRTYDDRSKRRHLPTLEAFVAASGNVGLTTLADVRARSSAAIEAIQAQLPDYAPVEANEITRLIEKAQRLEAQLTAAARSNGFSVTYAVPPARGGNNLTEDKPFAFSTQAALEAGKINRRESDGRVLQEPYKAAYGSTAGASTRRSSLADAYYRQAALRAEYLDIIDTLRAFQLHAASFVVRQDAAAGVSRDRLATFYGFTAERAFVDDPRLLKTSLDDLRQKLPILVDLRSPESLAICPRKARVRMPWILALDAASYLSDQTLIYHRFKPGTSLPTSRRTVERWKDVHDHAALLYARAIDIDGSTDKWRADRKIEPLVVHARAGDCMIAVLSNVIQSVSDPDVFSNLPNIADKLNINDIDTSREVGLHAQSVRKHVGKEDGMNVGTNSAQTVSPGQSTAYMWYAGVVDFRTSTPTFKDVEFGALNLQPAEPLRQGGKGLIGALVIEPKDAIMAFDQMPPEPFSGAASLLDTYTSALIDSGGKTWRDFTMVGQNDANFRIRGQRERRAIRYPGIGTLDPRLLDRITVSRELSSRLLGGKTNFRRIDVRRADARLVDPALTSLALQPADPFDLPVRRVAMCADGGSICPVEDDEVDAVDMGHKAFNYRSEAGWMRRVHSAAMPLSTILLTQQHDQLSDGFKGLNASNQTPRFCALGGDQVRVRMTFAGGHGRNHVIDFGGHTIDNQPFVNASADLGVDAASVFRGTLDVIGPGTAFNFLFTQGAGGDGKVDGDYPVRDLYSWGFDNGLWAVLRVGERCW